MVAISTDFMSFLSHSVSESLADLQGTSASQAFSCQVGLPQSQEKKKKNRRLAINHPKTFLRHLKEHNSLLTIVQSELHRHSPSNLGTHIEQTCLQREWERVLAHYEKGCVVLEGVFTQVSRDLPFPGLSFSNSLYISESASSLKGGIIKSAYLPELILWKHLQCAMNFYITLSAKIK